MDHRDRPPPPERPGRDHATGLHRFSPRLHHLPPPPRHNLLSQPVSRRPRTPVRPPHPVRVTDRPAPATGAPPWDRHPAVLPQTLKSRDPGTGWGPSPAPWGWEEQEEGTGGTDLPVWENLAANSKQRLEPTAPVAAAAAEIMEESHSIHTRQVCAREKLSANK